ncbi:OsmC family protein [Aureimonas frigidaquae]|uniref:OsmC family protein n=1 Tax=Aureimonas frigidaquae TaxID=424757 RepID=A0A0P0Z3P5_9HYPH|nr:OsmC family protein [Aureimonas frigidaquae]BAT28607.1 hypothetical protein [Aureimonas frigidaquae]
MTELDPDIASRVSGHADRRFGRVVLSARQNHFVSDGRVSHGGAGEAIFAGELLLASLVACGLGIVHETAHDRQEPKPDVELTAQFLRDPQDGTRFAALTLIFDFAETKRPLAELYVAAFTSRCPIYNTLARGGPIDVEIRAPG